MSVHHHESPSSTTEASGTAVTSPELRASTGRVVHNMCKASGGGGSVRYSRSTCVRTYTCRHAHTQKAWWWWGGGGNDAAARVPHLLSCERVPELALGQKNHINDTKDRHKTGEGSVFRAALELGSVASATGGFRV